MLYVDGEDNYWLVKRQIDGDIYECMPASAEGVCLGTIVVRINKVKLCKVD